MLKDIWKNKTLRFTYQSDSVEDTQKCAQTLAMISKDLFENGRYVQQSYRTNTLDVLPVGLTARSGSGKSVLSRNMVDELRFGEGVDFKNEEGGMENGRILQIWNVASNLSDFFEVRAYDAAMGMIRPDFMQQVPKRHCDGIDIIEHPHRSLLYKHADKSDRLTIEIEPVSQLSRDIRFTIPRATPSERDICEKYFYDLIYP